MIHPIPPPSGTAQTEIKTSPGNRAQTSEKRDDTRIPPRNGQVSRDGDVFELKSKGPDKADAGKSREEIREWVEMAKSQLEEQHLRLLEAGLRENSNSDSGRALSGVREALHRLEDPTLRRALEKGQIEKIEASQTGLAIPDYWNAENTAERIVNFATSFAGSQGEGTEAFVAKIRDAIAEGFAQAKAITGALPGAAGQLRRDTESLTFAKLDKWLEDRRSTPYNDVA